MPAESVICDFYIGKSLTPPRFRRALIRDEPETCQEATRMIPYDDNRIWVKRSEYRLEMPVELIHELKMFKPKIRNLQYDLINQSFPPSTPSLEKS